MNSELARIFRTAVSGRVLVYTTWLALGIYLTLQGVRQLLQTAQTDNSLFGYLMSAFQVVVGAAALWAADKVFESWSNPSAYVIRRMSLVLLIAFVGVPFFLFIVQSLAILSGQAEAGELYRQSFVQLIIIATYYLLAHAIVILRLKNNALNE